MLATLGMIATVVAVMALTPVVSELGTDQGKNIHYVYDDGTTITCLDSPNDVKISQACKARDTVTSAWLVLPMFMIVVIAVWAFLNVTRRDYGQYE